MSVATFNSFETEPIESLLEKYADDPQPWSEPTHFDMSSVADQNEVKRRLATGKITTTVQRMGSIANDLFEMHHPRAIHDDALRTGFVNGITSQGAQFGQWIHFDWSKKLVQYPDKSDYQDLRSFRNKSLVTAEEHTLLMGKSALVAGLSVGSHVVEQLALSSTVGTMMMSDFDILSTSNLNRIHASLADVDAAKIDIAARTVSEIDPYLQQTHFRRGVSQDDLDLLREQAPDIIFDEVDDLAAKALLRQFAADQKIPLVMATDIGDTSIIDIERHDLGTATPFNGRLSSTEIDAILSNRVSQSERKKMIMKIVGLRHASTRLIASSLEVGHTLGGLPQLGTTASIGGALSAITAREILLGRRAKSGRYVHAAKKTLQLGRQETLVETAKVVQRLMKNKSI